MSDTEITGLASDVGARLLARGMRLVTAESCTGGLIAGAITGIAGSSDWFERGMVTYSNAAKVEMLGVPQSSLDDFGAVSEPVARAMAEGALVRSRGFVAVAVTGVAGPGGGTADKPVGMVCFAWSFSDQPTQTETVHFPGDRATVRAMTVRHALLGLLNRLDSSPSGG